MHKIVQYPIRDDTAQAVTTSLELISLQTHSSPKTRNEKAGSLENILITSINLGVRISAHSGSHNAIRALT
jgi:hypothetical protein